MDFGMWALNYLKVVVVVMMMKKTDYLKESSVSYQEIGYYLKMDFGDVGIKLFEDDAVPNGGDEVLENGSDLMGFCE